MRALFYMDQAAIDQRRTPEGTTCLIYSDLIAWHSPACVLPDEEALLLGLRMDTRGGPLASWHVASVNRVLERSETGDAMLLSLADADEEQAGSLLRAPLVHWQLMAEFHWLPSPMTFPQPIPRALWRWFYSGGSDGAAGQGVG